jgi:hypothetical protein
MWLCYCAGGSATVRAFSSLVSSTGRRGATAVIVGTAYRSHYHHSSFVVTKRWSTSTVTRLRASLPTSIEAEATEYEDSSSQSNNNNNNKRSTQATSHGKLSQAYLTLPRHSNPAVNKILVKTETVIRNLHAFSRQIDQKTIEAAKADGRAHEKVYANNYVDLAKISVVGFDFDYTLVTYSEELLELIYDMALNRLVSSRQYPMEMLDSGLVFDPFFSIRGLAVDIKTGWVCHLSSTHKVAVAFEGRQRVPTSRIYAEYRGKRGMPPSERKRRLRPLNDLFSMSECCLIADTVQFFKDRGIPFNAQNLISDVRMIWTTVKSWSFTFHAIFF